MERIRRITHKEKNYIYLDYTNLLEEKFVHLIHKATDFQISSGQKEIWVICDVTNTRTTPRVLKASRDSYNTLVKNGIKQHLATIGLNKMQRVIANSIRSETYAAKDMDDALKWFERIAI